MPVILKWFLRLGPTNPITVRLVQNGSRRVRHLYIRSAYLAALILLLLWSLLAPAGGGAISFRDLAQFGADSFTYVAYLQVGLICVLAPVFMAGAIAQEANPRTWDIMLTTPMGPLQIVLGNLFGRLFFILALLVSSLPLFAITKYFGGVPAPAIFTSYLIAAAAALFVGSMAIALSVSRLVGKRAVFAFYVAVVSYVVLSFALDYWLRSQGKGAGPGGTGVTWMTGLNPFLALQALLNPTSYPAAVAGSHAGLGAWFLERPITTFCVGSLLLSVFLIAASTLTVRTGGLTMLTGESGTPWYRRLLGLGRAGAEHRPPRNVWANPIAWREAAARNATLGRMVARWAFIGAGVLWAIALVAMFHGGGMKATDFQLALLATVLGEVAVTTLVAMNMSATAISREREDGTLDLILTTPITPGQYLSGKLRGLVAYIAPMLAVPIFTLALAGLYVATDGLGSAGGASPAVTVPYTSSQSTTPTQLPLVLPEGALLAALVFLPFMAFCVMVGLHWSLKSKGTLTSVVMTVAVVGIVSGVVGLCGWQASPGFTFVGPSLGALSPATLVWAIITPGPATDKTFAQTDSLETSRLSLLIGSVVAAGIYIGIVAGMHRALKHGFDFTVRKLAGMH
ncbi:MAG: ABC transporter permease [Phycisphaerales bacterium]